MITVDCKEVQPIKHELLVYVSDQVGAIPLLKLHEFNLSPIELEDKIDTNQVTIAIREFLDSIGEGHNFAVLPKENVILIKSIYGKKIDRFPRPVRTICGNCGF